MIYHDNFDGTSFNQTAAEYIALCLQTYRFARMQLEENLKGLLPGAKPCVIFDLDETLLDNSPANAALIRDGALFSEGGNWKDWCNLRQTALVPGARSFVRLCAERYGLEVIYITSRQNADVRDATKSDLTRHGLPLVNSDDPFSTNLFMQNMGDVVAPSGNKYTLNNKFQQRDFLVRERGLSVALILGDNLGDWDPLYSNGVDYQQRVTNLWENSAGLGRDFILLPNPMYGSWQITLANRYPDSAVPNSLQPVTAKEAPRLNALHFPV